MVFKINPIICITILIGIGILIFSLLRGCQQSNLQLQTNHELILKNNDLQKSLNQQLHTSDSMEHDFKDTIEFINGQYDLVQNQKERLENDFDAAKDTIKKLVAKFKAHNYKDTNTTAVPNDFIIDCEDCMTRIESEVELAEKYKNQVKISDSICDIKSKKYEQQLNQQDKEKRSLVKISQDCIDLNKKTQETLKSKRQLYFAWGVLFKPLIPKMAGVGLMYQDKHKIIWSAKGWFGNYGNMWEANINLPLSLKRKN